MPLLQGSCTTNSHLLCCRLQLQGEYPQQSPCQCSSAYLTSTAPSQAPSPIATHLRLIKNCVDISGHELLSCEHQDLRAKVKGMRGHGTWLMMKSGANSSSGSLAASEASAFRACSGAAARGAAALAAKLLSVAAPLGLPLLAASIWAPATPFMPAWHNVDMCAITLSTATVQQDCYWW